MSTTPKDGDTFADYGDFFCSCGRGPYKLWWNGGELDSRKCACGLWYYGEHQRTLIRVNRKGPYAG